MRATPCDFAVAPTPDPRQVLQAVWCGLAKAVPGRATGTPGGFVTLEAVAIVTVSSPVHLKILPATSRMARSQTSTTWPKRSLCI